MVHTVHQTCETQYRWIRVRGPWFIQHPTGHIGPHSVSVKSCHLCFLPDESPGLIQGDTRKMSFTVFNKIFWTCDLVIASPALYQVHLHLIHWLSLYKSEYPLLSVNSSSLTTMTGCKKEITIVGWLIEQGLTSPPTQYRYLGDNLQVKRPNQQYQRTERKYATKVRKPRKSKQHKIRQHNKQTHKKHSKSPSLH